MTQSVRAAGLRAVVLGAREDQADPDSDNLPPSQYGKRLRDLIPTPLVTTNSRRTIVIRPVPSRPWWRGPWCLALIVGYFMRRTALKWVGRLNAEDDAHNARRLFERLSGMWIKLGQLLSLKTDILSDAMCRELAALQYEVAGFPTEVAMNVLREDLREPIAAVFSLVEAQPFAAASICQVHRATLRDGDRSVVVKIMRPDVAGAFESDMRLLGVLVFAINILGLGSRLNLKDGLAELSSALREETDYTQELVNLRQMRRRLKEHDIIVPRCYPRYSGSRVLVMDEVPGVLMSEYIRQRREDASVVEAWERENGIDPDRIARRLLTSAMRQILEDNLFHGDLHPGNIILLSDNHIALIDFGTIGRLPTRTWLMYKEMTASISMNDYERAADYMLLLGGSVPAFGVTELRRGLADIFRKWEARAQIETLPYNERSMASVSLETAKLMAVYKVPATWSLLRVGRALSTLDASLQVLAPDGNFMRLYKAYFRNLRKRRTSWQGRVEAIQGTVQQLSKIGGDLKTLLVPQIRQLALTERGMADSFTRVKVALLNVLRRGLFGMVALTIIALVIDKRGKEIEAHVPGNWASIVDRPIEGIKNAVPDLPFVDDLMIAVGFFFVAHVLGVLRRSMTSRN